MLSETNLALKRRIIKETGFIVFELSVTNKFKYVVKPDEPLNVEIEAEIKSELIRKWQSTNVQ
jgi:hypothetical protein